MKNTLKIKVVPNPNMISNKAGIITLKNSGGVKASVAIEEGKKKDIRWIWSTAMNKLNFTVNDFNDNYITGLTEETFIFPRILEGGGFAYVEAFHLSGTSQLANSPNFGKLIQAIGTPKILAVQWRHYKKDGRGELIKDKTKVKIGASVQLHIYTQALYGQDLEIQLFDYDSLTKNDKLPAFERQNRKSVDIKDGEDKEYPDMPPKTTFQREVGFFQIKNGDSIPENAITDRLNGNGKGALDTYNVQKCIVDVYIDPFWVNFPYANETEISLFASIKHKNTDKWTSFGNNILAIEAEEVDSDLAPVGNKPVVVGNIETKEAFYRPCKYTKIIGNFDKEAIIFEQNPGASSIRNLKYEVVADDKPKKLEIKLPDVTTVDCNHTGSKKDHTGQVVTLVNPQSFANKNVSDSQLSFDVSYPKPSESEAILMSSLSTFKPLIYKVGFNTCRFTHPLEIEVYPKIEYTINAHLGVEENEYLYVTQTKNYKKRDYKGKKKDGTRAAKKAHNKKRKDSLNEDVDNQVKKDNFREKYKVSVGMEYKFGEGEPTAIELTTVKTFQEIIENVMYVYDTVDSFLFGEQMKKSEEGEEIDEAGNKKNLTPEQKRKNKKDYEDKKKTRERKKKKSMPKAAGFPVRFEVTPPKFTGGVTWSYTPSVNDTNLLGVNYQFKLGALPLVGIAGRLDLLFVAQFIPYVGQVVKLLDKAVAAMNKVGDALQYLKLGTMEAEYYFDLVATAQLDIDVVKGATYHTIDGFTAGHVQIESPLAISLEAGGSIKAQFIDVKGEAAISAAATAKFKIYYLSDRKEFMTFEFEGIEAIVKTKFVLEDKKGESNEEESEEETAEDGEQPINILKGFKIDIPLFKGTIIENPHKDEN